MSDSTPFPPFFEEPALRLRMFRRRIWCARYTWLRRIGQALFLGTAGYLTLVLWLVL